jgi:hypothetical protein
MGAGKKGDGRSRHDARALDQNPGFAETGGKRRGNPGTGFAGIAPEDDLWRYRRGGLLRFASQ